MNINCIILDDDPLHIEELLELIDEIDGAQVIATFTKPAELIQFLNEKEVDLMFLDIEMDGLSGLELMKTLKQKPMVVFVTAYPEYAVESFEFEPLNYIVKPATYLDIVKSVERARQRKKGLKEENDYIFIKTGYSKFIKLAYKNILFIQSLGDFIIIQTSSEKYMTYLKLKDIRKHLPSYFLQTHRSYIVNSKNITSISTGEIQIQKFTIPVSRSYKSEIEEGILKGHIPKR
ncbi:MAG: response regulator transcription factor [Bacteroidales bacterium]|nr:response regulator transcription factor [Bacteroidales bacterium]